MRCTEDRLITQRYIDTNFTSHVDTNDGPNTIFCVVTSTAMTNESVTCLGGMDEISTEGIINPPEPLPPFYDWYAEYGDLAMGCVFGASCISILFYVSWLRRAEEGDVVLYRLDAVMEKVTNSFSRAA